MVKEEEKIFCSPERFANTKYLTLLLCTRNGHRQQKKEACHLKLSRWRNNTRYKQYKGHFMCRKHKKTLPLVIAFHFFLIQGGQHHLELEAAGRAISKDCHCPW